MPDLFAHPYAALLQRVEKPSRYTGTEHGARRKDWAGVEARICLAFPDIYDIGMSHLGFRILYKILNDDPRTLAERAYTPWIDMQRELRGSGHLLVALESGRPLCDFGASSAELVRYGNSGEVSGDYERVVGYAGMLVR